MSANRIFLKGIDYFQLLIDHHSKKNGGRGHEARLAIFLKGKVDENQVRNTLLKNEIWHQLSKVRISKTFGLGFPSLYFSDSPSEIPVTFLTVNESVIPQTCLNIPVDVYNNAPLHLQVIYLSNGMSCLLFTLHHILFDFAGVQALIYSLCGDKDVTLLPVKHKVRSFSTRFTSFFKAVFFTFRETNRKMTVSQKPIPNQIPSDIIFKEISFSKEETQQIDYNCEYLNLQMNHSILFLSAVSKSLHDELFSKQQYNNFQWIPVPVNIRRKGTGDAVLFNGLSFLFYKLKREELRDLKTVVESIRLQMKSQMRQKMPEAFIDFADGYWYMPMPFYYPMMKLPSWGKLSSFSFSVLGNTFKYLNEFMGLPVTDVKNYPSNSTSPGITFLFYEYRGELKMMSSWVKGQYSDEEQDAVIRYLRELLLKPLASTTS